MTAINPDLDQPTNKFFSDVVDFNTRVLNIEQRPLNTLSQAEFDISQKCLQEEVDEFVEAYKNGDIITTIDSVVDLMYFGVGVLYKMGLDAEQISAVCSAVHDANMEKKLGVVAKRGDGSAADAVKPEGWVGPEERIGHILDAIVANQ